MLLARVCGILAFGSAFYQRNIALEAVVAGMSDSILVVTEPHKLNVQRLTVDVSSTLSAYFRGNGTLLMWTELRLLGSVQVFSRDNVQPDRDSFCFVCSLCDPCGSNSPRPTDACVSSSGGGLGQVLLPLGEPCPTSVMCSPSCTTSQTCLSAVGLCQDSVAFAATSTADWTWVIIVAVVVPSVVLLSVVMAVLVKVYHTRTSASYTLRENQEIAYRQMDDLVRK